MKASDVIKQLQILLPRFTDLFNDILGVVAAEFSGGIVTITTDSDHGLKDGDIVDISGSDTPVIVSSIIREGNIATVTTEEDHDITLGFQETVNISGSTVDAYNGDFAPIEVPNRRTLTYEVLGDPTTPAPGSIFLNDGKNRGYNGLQVITVTGPKTFTYPTSGTPISPAQGTIKVSKNTRVSGAVSIERFLQAYTQQEKDQYWACVVLGDTIANKDRDILNDASYYTSNGTVYRQRLITPFSIYVVAPAIDSIAGREQRDSMEDVSVAFYKSVLRKRLPTELSEEDLYGITADGDGFFGYFNAFYVHRFDFETIKDITYEDTIDDDSTVAFRDIDVIFNDPFDLTNEVVMTADINLDEEPL